MIDIVKYFNLILNKLIIIVIEFDDRLAAKNTIDKLNQQIKAKPVKASKNQQIKQSLERKKKQMHVSACERNLFNEAKQIIKKKELETQRIDSINAQTLKVINKNKFLIKILNLKYKRINIQQIMEIQYLKRQLFGKYLKMKVKIQFNL